VALPITLKSVLRAKKRRIMETQIFHYPKKNLKNLPQNKTHPLKETKILQKRERERLS
jgi:hypothetical protein